MPKKTENSRHVGLQEDGSFYGDFSEWKEMLRMLLVCVELGKIPPLCKLKELICESSLFSIDTAFTAMYKAVLQDGGTS